MAVSLPDFTRYAAGTGGIEINRWMRMGEPIFGYPNSRPTFRGFVSKIHLEQYYFKLKIILFKVIVRGSEKPDEN